MWLDDLTSLKTTWTTGKNIVWRKKLRRHSFYIYIETITYLTRVNLSYETMITPNKTNYEA